MILAQDFEDFIKLLHHHQVEYMVVGGYALAFHGKPRRYPSLRIDILNNIDGVEFANASQCMQKTEAEPGLKINYIGLNDFIKNKQASGRSQDLSDIKEIKKACQKGSKKGKA